MLLNLVFFKIDSTTTGFFGGANNPHGITTFNWETMTYTKHKPELSGDRRGSACTVLTGQHGEKLVAVAGGISSGMEAWNPADESVQILTANFPPGNNDFPKVFL